MVTVTASLGQQNPLCSHHPHPVPFLCYLPVLPHSSRAELWALGCLTPCQQHSPGAPALPALYQLGNPGLRHLCSTSPRTLLTPSSLCISSAYCRPPTWVQNTVSSFSPLAEIFSRSHKWLTMAEKPWDKFEKYWIGSLKRLLQYRDLFQFAFCRFTVVSYFSFTCQCWKCVFYALKIEICSIPRTPGGGTPRTTVNIRFLLQMATSN